MGSAVRDALRARRSNRPWRGQRARRRGHLAQSPTEGSDMGTTHKTLVGVIAALALATAAPAFADDSSLQGYGGPGSDVLSEIQQPSGNATQQSAPVENKAGQSAKA